MRNMTLSDSACFVIGMTVGLVLLAGLVVEVSGRRFVKRVWKVLW